MSNLSLFLAISGFLFSAYLFIAGGAYLAVWRRSCSAWKTYASRCVMMAAMSEPQTLYDVIGGETRVREMVDRFYDLMELEPEFVGLRALHPPSTEGSRDKLFMFLSGWMGGPDLFVEQYGHPRLRARHLPFAIGSSERDQWLRAMAWAMEDVGIDEGLRLRLMESFYQTADWMRNKAD